jgi:ATP-dependent Clp protease adaptor protein ClpS
MMSRTHRLLVEEIPVACVNSTDTDVSTGFAMAATNPSPVRTPSAGTEVEPQLEDLYQVVLFNDDHNTMEHVVDCLARVFSHPVELAIKITLEAHENGKSIAEVESETPAKLHKDQLISLGLTAELERI